MEGCGGCEEERQIAEGVLHDRWRSGIKAGRCKQVCAKCQKEAKARQDQLKKEKEERLRLIAAGEMHDQYLDVRQAGSKVGTVG